MTRLEVMRQPSCSSYALQELELLDGSDYLASIRPFFVEPMSQKKSFLADNLVDPEAPNIRADLPAVPEVPPTRSTIAARSVSRKRKGKQPVTRRTVSKKAVPVEDVSSSPEDSSFVEPSVEASYETTQTAAPKNVSPTPTSSHTSPLSPRTIASGFTTPPGSVRAGTVLVQEQFLSTEDMLVDDVDVTPANVPKSPSILAFADPPSSSIEPHSSKVTSDQVTRTVPASSKVVICPGSCPDESPSGGGDEEFARMTFSDDVVMPEVVSVRSLLDTSSTDTYVPEWSVTHSDHLDDPKVCRQVIDHLAPPVTAQRLQESSFRNLTSELSQALAQAVALTAEGLHRWSYTREVARASRGRITQLLRRLEIREKEMDLLENKLGLVVAKKNRNFAKYKDLLHDNSQLRVANAALTADCEKLRKEVIQAQNRPAVTPNPTVVHTDILSSLTRRAEAAERDLLATRELLDAREKEKSLYVESLAQAAREKEKISADGVWLVETGIKEFLLKLMGSSEFQTSRAQLCNLARRAGFAEGAREGHLSAKLKIPLTSIMSYDARAPELFNEALEAAAVAVNYPYLDALAAQAGKPVDVLRSIRPDSPGHE